MESQAITDTSIDNLKTENMRVRFAGKVVSFDEKTGMFEVEDGGAKTTCLPNYQENPALKSADIVLVTGRTVAADSSFEIRADRAEKININEYNNYKKYLKIRDDLLSNGS